MVSHTLSLEQGTRLEAVSGPKEVMSIKNNNYHEFEGRFSYNKLRIN